MSNANATPGYAASSAFRPSARGICAWYQAVDVARAAASCRYRIGHFVELTSGADAVVGRSIPASVRGHTRAVSCLRPLLTPEHSRALGRLRAAGIRLVADYDDLIFAGEVAGLPESVAGTGVERERQIRLGRYAAALGAFDAFTVSTRALGRRLGELLPGAPIDVVPNGLSARWVAQGTAVYRRFRAEDPLVIRYFAGSPSHDRDFASIVPPLQRFLAVHPEVRIEVVGFLRIDRKAFPLDRFAVLPAVEYEELPRLLASAWVNVAPLAASTFNECKSAIKYLEAGAFGCPTLASPNDDVLRRRELGAAVLLCRNAEDWFQCLEAMLDLDQRGSLGSAAADDVHRRGLACHSLGAWLEALRPKSPPNGRR